jgi:signal peptidase I
MAATAAIPRIEEKERFIFRPTESGSEISRKIRSQGSLCLRVLGGSMTPWIRSGDLVFIKRFDFERVSTGDVILFERDGRFFVHRIIDRSHNVTGRKGVSQLVTKGDALDRADARVSAEEFLGRATRIHRGRHHIDLESFTQVLLGRVLAHLSRMSPLLYRPIRFAKHLFFG